MADRPLNMKLVYEGKEVDDGSMPVEEIVAALQGFSGAYPKVANSLVPSSSHTLRVSAVEKGSFELAILALVSSHPEAVGAIKTMTASAARYIFGVVKDVIEAKKHIKAKPYEISVRGNENVVVVINTEGESRPITKEVLEILKSNVD
jgi:hypothetical protein